MRHTAAGEEGGGATRGGVYLPRGFHPEGYHLPDGIMVPISTKGSSDLELKTGGPRMVRRLGFWCNAGPCIWRPTSNPVS